MREAFGGEGLFIIVIVLILFFTGFFCISINYTSAYKVTDSINNQIKKDDGVIPENITEVLKEVHYASQDECNKGSNNGWTPMDFNGIRMVDDGKAFYCLKKVEISDGSETLPNMVYYKVKVFYTVEIPLISRLQFDVQADSTNIYTDESTITIPATTEVVS